MNQYDDGDNHDGMNADWNKIGVERSKLRNYGCVS